MANVKIIHYCWFGPKKIPEIELECIESWKVILPDYKIMFWNEETFDLNSSVFASQAYNSKHYAFVSDYVRAKVLFEYGGIYLDTDVELLDGFNKVLVGANNFLGFETKAKIGTAIMCFMPRHAVLERFLDYYNSTKFISNNGDVNTIANVTILTDILLKLGLKAGGAEQFVSDIKIFSREYFYPKKISNSEFNVTADTVAIHKCSNSWMTKREKRRGNSKIWINVLRPLLRYFRSVGINVLGNDRVQKIEVKLRNVLK